MPATAYELPPHVLVTLRGERALAFVQDVCAQDVARLTPGTGAHAAFLDDKGRVLADAVVLAGEDRVHLLAEESCLPGLERAVLRVAPLAGVEAAVERCEAALVTGGGAPAGDPPHTWLRAGDAIVVRVAWHDDGVLVLAPTIDAVRTAARAWGSVWGDPATAEAMRIAAGRPRYGTDVTAEDLVNETPLAVTAVAADKGCYPGQESVARVRNLGRIRRRLTVLEGAGAPPPPGARIELGGEDVGRVTSAAAWDGVALALGSVRADVPAGAEVRAGRHPMRVRDAGGQSGE